MSDQELTVAQRDRALVAAIMGRKDWGDATDYRNTGAQDREVERLLKLVQDYRLQAEAGLKEGRAELLAKALEALEQVEGAMLNGGDGRTGDFGWVITKLNAARPAIREALSLFRDGGGDAD